jgi:hypothetical protein
MGIVFILQIVFNTILLKKINEDIKRGRLCLC